MRRTLSSAQTFLVKFIVPSVWLAGATTATVLLFTTGHITTRSGPAPPETKWSLLAATVLGGGLLYWGCMRLKRVEIDNEWLYISNFRREIRVSLRDVKQVTENRWISFRPVTIEFRRETDFGPRITFILQGSSLLWFWQPDPEVAELEAAIRGVRGLPQTGPAA